MSSISKGSRAEQIKLNRFIQKLKDIKQNDDEYLGLEIIEDALLDFRVYQEDIHNYYVFGRQLGWGKFGVVRLAYSKSNSNFEVAIKVINLKLIKQKYHYLAQEIVSLKRVDHPNIIKLLEIYKQEDKIYLVMEKGKGMDLLDYLFSLKTMREVDAVCIVKQILKALRHLNSLDIWHRDIKLENIMIDPETMIVKL